MFIAISPNFLCLSLLRLLELWASFLFTLYTLLSGQNSQLCGWLQYGHKGRCLVLKSACYDDSLPISCIVPPLDHSCWLMTSVQDSPCLHRLHLFRIMDVCHNEEISNNVPPAHMHMEVIPRMGNRKFIWDGLRA